jgi:hypothetical protein
MKYNRLTDNDQHLGPITIGEKSKHWRPLGISIQSGDEEHHGCSLMLRWFGWPVRVALPQIIKPWREFHPVKNDPYWDQHGGGYWNVWRREFGFTVSDGALHLYYGPQTHDSITTKSKCWFLPWREWRFVRHSLYGLDGEEFWTERQGERRSFDAYFEAKKQAPTRVFLFKDFDGEEIKATTRIEEREWLRGDKWCKWLSWFYAPKVSRSLDLEFSKEVGREKGSWKGGTMGHSIEMLPGELHESAFRRYCAQGMSSKHGTSAMTFIGAVSLT